MNEVKRMQMSVINSRSNGKSFTTDLNNTNQQKKQTLAKMMRVGSTSNTLNIQTLTSTQVSALSQGDFGTNLSNQAGINNILMNDIVDDMNDNNEHNNDDDQDIIQGMTTTRGGNIDETGTVTGTGTDDGMVNTDTNSTGDVSDDGEHMITNQINDMNHVTMGGLNVYENNYENNAQEGNDEYEYDVYITITDAYQGSSL